MSSSSKSIGTLTNCTSTDLPNTASPERCGLKTISRRRSPVGKEATTAEQRDPWTVDIPRQMVTVPAGTFEAIVFQKAGELAQNVLVCSRGGEGQRDRRADRRAREFQRSQGPVSPRLSRNDMNQRLRWRRLLGFGLFCVSPLATATAHAEAPESESPAIEAPAPQAPVDSPAPTPVDSPAVDSPAVDSPAGEAPAPPARLDTSKDRQLPEAPAGHHKKTHKSEPSDKTTASAGADPGDPWGDEHGGFEMGALSLRTLIQTRYTSTSANASTNPRASYALREDYLVRQDDGFTLNRFFVRIGGADPSGLVGAKGISGFRRATQRRNEQRGETGLRDAAPHS